jgi:nucleotide-binding universal stress UspA family protein
MFLNILVAVDGSPSSLHALHEAVDLARAQNSTLTILTVAPPAPPLLPVTGVDPAALREDVERWAAQILADAAATVPDDVLLRTVQRSGHPGSEVVRELAGGRYDLVVLGSRGRGPARSGLLGSVNGSVHYHSSVPMLSVPGADPDDEPREALAVVAGAGGDAAA